MNFDDLTEGELESLRTMPKLVTNPQARWKEKPGHRQRNHVLQGDRYQFELYLRQNANDNRDFSCGLAVIKPNGTRLTLCRYNGSSHVHREIRFRCHIHKATAESIRAGRKPEEHAEQTDRYVSLEGALCRLADDCALSGLPGLRPDEPDMFDEI